ncbi:MAG: hypothetical protein JO017_12330 [Actinobacteria bacterium]|nr:hypothetical protein [Actinomycetota bacterium]
MRKLVAVAAVGLALVGTALAGSSRTTVTVKVSTALGAKILVNASGMTLYHYTDEAKGKIDCTGSCATFWPPLLATGKPVAGPGLAVAKLGTVTRPDGKVQVTYNGLALYRYAGDKKAGDTNGQGVDGSWFAVTSAGTITKAKVSAAAKSTPVNSSTSVSGSSSTPASSGGTNANGCTPGAIVTDANSPCYNY